MANVLHSACNLQNGYTYYGDCLIICDTLAYQANVMDTHTNLGVPILKVRFAVDYLFDTGLFFPKFSIVSFYYILVPPTQPQMRMVFCLVTIFDNTFWCGTDISSNWSTEPGACKAHDSFVMLRVHWSLNFITEVLSLGVVTIVVSIGRYVHMVTVGPSLGNYLWASSELCVSIVVVALTALRPLLRRISHMLNSSMSGSNRRSGYVGTSTDPRSRTARSKSTHTHTQGSSAYWRNILGTRYKGANEDDNGSEVELNDVKSGGVLKTREIRISIETLSQDGYREYPPGSSRPMGVEASIMA
ncbi:hypothetical protein EDB81DRAFT_767332 [Dactylonectria macrodidyma]|uniref:Uncharacterized protein n=1 Tax=Dactylonectria macrodidyma TaxID=307937 RepID=A0A9P9D9K6_9HYPO|nr:hypothetical protein EDB81DRAFT_767332 [Dactylonectria macrodidyma]